MDVFVAVVSYFRLLCNSVAAAATMTIMAILIAMYAVVGSALVG
jgi:hypothetical protein